MEYNFSGISVNTLADIEKKLRKIKSNVLDDISNFIRILNDTKITETSGELAAVISDLFNDQIAKTEIQFTETLNKVQRALAQYL